MDMINTDFTHYKSADGYWSSGAQWTLIISIATIFGIQFRSQFSSGGKQVTTRL